MSRRKTEAELRRNALTLRWSDSEMQLVADTAWRRRTSCAAMIREIVLEMLQDEIEEGRAS
ncbi:MAG: hypothetical protein K8T26_11060 [Lentisphaerae bacterium]|nr:hypothetical protein [Lentisphaerota bacterium]